jgi:hypothetical protein
MVSMNLDKLPKWAREHIRKIEQERDNAIKALNDFRDDQTPSPIYTEDLVCTGETRGPSVKRRYIQDVDLKIEFEGIRVDITLYPREKAIRISYGNADRRIEDVAMIPRSTNHVSIERLVGDRSKAYGGAA